MVAIASLEENFTGAAAGVAVSTTNTIFDNLSGTGTSIFNADNYVANRPSVEFVCAAGFRICRADHTQAGGWRGFALKIVADFSVNTPVAMWYNGTTLGGGVRLMADRTLQIRDADSVARFTSAAPLALDSWYWITFKVDQNSARLKIYNGTTGALIQDSGALVTGFTTVNPDNLRVGPQSSVTGTIRIARMRADDAVEPADAAHSNPIAAGVMTAYHKIDTAGSNGVMTLARTSGDAVTITGPSAGVFTIEHPDPVVNAIGLTLTATDAGATATKNFVIPSGSGASPTNRKVWNGAAWL